MLSVSYGECRFLYLMCRSVFPSHADGRIPYAKSTRNPREKREMIKYAKKGEIREKTIRVHNHQKPLTKCILCFERE